MILHPHLDENGRPVHIHEPHTASGERTFTPQCPTPSHINGQALTDESEPHHGLTLHSDDHTFKSHPHKATAAGMVIVEPDHRVWIVSPTNKFGGYENTFPKGRHDAESPSLKHTAAKEAWEETGIKAEPTHHLGDYERSTTKTRFYVGRRVGGNPAHMGWESQAVHLVPIDELHHHLHSPVDHQILSDLKAHLRRQSALGKVKSLFSK